MKRRLSVTLMLSGLLILTGCDAAKPLKETEELLKRMQDPVNQAKAISEVALDPEAAGLWMLDEQGRTVPTLANIEMLGPEGYKRLREKMPYLPISYEQYHQYASRPDDPRNIPQTLPGAVPPSPATRQPRNKLLDRLAPPDGPLTPFNQKDHSALKQTP
jgi:hypothetical protein